VIRGTSSGRRVLLIGLDAMSPDVADGFIRDGHLPNLAQLQRVSAHADIVHESGYFVGAVWPTMLTGVPVTAHGWYCGSRYDSLLGHYVMHPLDHPTMFDHASERGIRTLMVDVPHVPPSLHGGFSVVEWGTHDRFFGASSAPSELLAEMVERFGQHPFNGMPDRGDPRFAPCDAYVEDILSRDAADPLVGFRDGLLEGVRKRADMFEWLWHRDSPDFAAVVFAEAHCAGHHLWHLHESSNLRFDAAAYQAHGGDPLLTVYSALDDALGQLLASCASDDVDAYVLLSHGMAAHFDGTHLLPRVLQTLDDRWSADRTALGRPLRRLAARIGGHAPRTMVRAGGAAAPVLRRRFNGRVPNGNVTRDNSGRRWFSLDNNTVFGAIRLNVADREVNGRLMPAERETAIDYLRHELCQLINLDTGRPVVHSVDVSGSSHGHGQHHEVADLLVTWMRDAPVTRVWSPAVGLVSQVDSSVRSGDHVGRGRLLVRAHGVRPSSGGISPLELAPTLLASAGVDAPPIMQKAVPRLISPRRWIVPHRHPPVDSHDGNLRAAVPDPVADEIRHGQLAYEILATTSVAAVAPIHGSPRVSIIIPTWNRASQVLHAVESALRQTWHNVEVIVVDDASDDDSVDVLRAVSDDRLVLLDSTRRAGAAAARNRGLEVATGDYVTYLDSDNIMQPLWARAVVWAFQEKPANLWLYGARAADDESRHVDRVPGGLPWIELEPWDHVELTKRPFIDTGVMAHRRAVGARFDEELITMQDYDFSLRLAKLGEPIRLPVVALAYLTSDPARMSIKLLHHEADTINTIQGRHGRS
jgi:predicted AlkP superfamily phosphohydrolase/phosphomutase